MTAPGGSCGGSIVPRNVRSSATFPTVSGRPRTPGVSVGRCVIRSEDCGGTGLVIIESFARSKKPGSSC